MAIKRIPSNAINSGEPYQDGDLVTGQMVNQVVKVLKDGVNYNKFFIDAMFAGDTEEALVLGTPKNHTMTEEADITFITNYLLGLDDFTVDLDSPDIKKVFLFRCLYEDDADEDLITGVASIKYYKGTKIAEQINLDQYIYYYTWAIAHDVSMDTFIKGISNDFSVYDELTTLANNDLFVVTDISEELPKRITKLNLKETLGVNALNDKIDDIENGNTPIAFDKTGTDLDAEFIEEAIKEVNVKTNANEQNIEKIVDGTTIVKKAEQDASGNVITTTYETKSDATSKKAEIDGRIDTVEGRLDTAEDEIDTLQSTKVPKTTTIIGLDLQDNILIGEFRTALGNATPSVAGLLSAADKTHLDGLVALLETGDDNNVVDTMGEILAIFQEYPEGADFVTVLQGKVDKVAGKGLSTNDYTDVDKNKVNSTYTQQEINALLDNLTSVKGLKSTLLTPTELSNGDTVATNLLTNNGAYIIFTATNVANDEIDSDTVPVSTIVAGKKFVFFDNQEIVFTIGETNSTFETSEDITLKINLLYLDSENVKAVGVEFDGSLTNYLLSQTNVQEAIEKIDNELKTTNDNKVDKITGKGLSTEDYTTTEKNKLSGIEAGAEVNVQSDWTQEVNTADDYIKNKPAIPTKVSDLTNDSGFITTETDPIFTAWDKSTGISITKSQVSDLIEATQSLSGLMSATDKQRLDALHALLEEDTSNSVVDSINEILAIFNNYPEGADLVTVLAGKVDKNNAITAGTKTKITYDSKGLVTSGADLTEADIPALPASRITQTTERRFVSDTEKSTWNGKQDALTAGDGISISGNVISASGGLTVASWGTTTKTLALSDSNNLFRCADIVTQTLTIPTNSTAAFPVGTMITFLLTGTNTITFVGESGVTLTSMNGLVELKTQYAMASLIKTNTNIWQLVGALE